MSELRSSDLRTSDLQASLYGLWLPLITPFRDGALDEASLRRLVRHYISLPVDGLVLAATTGESLTLAPGETEQLVFTVRDEAGKTKNLPILLGLSGSDTRALSDTLERTAGWPIDGHLISCPSYSRPSQRGLELHFRALADRAVHPVLLYNIPYRTGVNLGNEAMLRLASHPNIAGLKDCCADRDQSLELLRRRPQKFAVLTGEDAQYQEALSDGVRAHRNRDICRDLPTAGGGRTRRRAGALGIGRRSHPAVVCRAEPGADQALAVAQRTDRQRGGTAADDGGEHGARRADRSGDRAASVRSLRGAQRRRGSPCFVTPGWCVSSSIGHLRG